MGTWSWRCRSHFTPDNNSADQHSLAVWQGTDDFVRSLQNSLHGQSFLKGKLRRGDGAHSRAVMASWLPVLGNLPKPTILFVCLPSVDTRGEVRLVSCLYVAVLLSEHIFASGDERHNLRYGFHAPLYGGVPIRDGSKWKHPQYADINDEELREIEAELGHPEQGSWRNGLFATA